MAAWRRRDRPRCCEGWLPWVVSGRLPLADRRRARTQSQEPQRAQQSRRRSPPNPGVLGTFWIARLRMLTRRVRGLQSRRGEPSSQCLRKAATKGLIGQTRRGEPYRHRPLVAAHFAHHKLVVADLIYEVQALNSVARPQIHARPWASHSSAAARTRAIRPRLANVPLERPPSRQAVSNVGRSPASLLDLWLQTTRSRSSGPILTHHER